MSQPTGLARFETAKNLFKSGMAHFNRMEYLAAAEFFRNAVAEYPEYYSARDYLARAYSLAGFIDAASSELAVMQNMFPDDPAPAVRGETIVFRDSFPTTPPLLSGLVLKETITSANIRRSGFSAPTDIAVDAKKNVYITSFESGRLIKLNPQGQTEFSISPRQLGRLYGVDCRNGIIAVSNFKDDEIFIYDETGKQAGVFGIHGNGKGAFHGPQGLCFGEQNYLYVVDAGNNRVQKFNLSGQFILQFGVKGNRDGELESPTDIAFAEGLVYVTDTGNKRVSVFDVYGNFVRQIYDAAFESPRGITTASGSIIISDEINGLIAYNAANGDRTDLTGWGDGIRKEHFGRLISAAFDRDGFLYCLDYGKEEILVFSPEQKQYTNLDMEIVSVDTAMFPTVAFYVNLRDRSGKPIVGLAPENFTVTEDNAVIQSKTVDYLKSRAPSVSAVMCVDRSFANKKNHEQLPWLADFFLTKMHTDDSLQVLNFAEDCREADKFDWSRRRILQSVSKAEYGRGKNMGKAFYTALTNLVPKLNRRAVLMLTDGKVDENSFSQYTARTIVNYARAHFIPVFIISIGVPDDTLTYIAEQTGGGILRPSELNRLNSIYNAVKNSEEYRYVIVYSTFKRSLFKGWWANVKINADYRGMKGLQWGGYFVAE